MAYKNIFLYESFNVYKNYSKLKKFFILKKINKSVLSFKAKDKVYVIYSKFGTNLDKSYLKKFKNLKYIISATTGLTHIDQDFCKKKNINIISLKKSNKKLKKITSTAELTLTFVLMSVRNIPSYFANAKKNNWNRYLNKFYQFHNYTVGIIGYGRIGQMINKYLKSLKFKTLIYDIKHQNFNDLKRLLEKSDIITSHIKEKNNHNFFDIKKFNLMKKNVTFINTSRGEVVNEKDLLFFLKKNKKANVFLDVINNEYKSINNLNKSGLLNYHIKSNNLFITPHIGGAAVDALKLTEDIVIKQFLNILKK